MKYCFVFVCQEGNLECEAVLLAASLKRYVQGEYECVAAIPYPTQRWGTVSKETFKLLDILGVRCVPITNWVNDNYPIGN